MNNRTMIQFFEWYLPADATLWQETAHKAATLSGLGITDVWLPPAYKGAAGKEDVGYGVYDLYDLGEFDQKGSVCTKYGSKDDYLKAVQALQNRGLSVYADVVLNHRIGADDTERVRAKVFDFSNRTRQIGERDIEAYTKFTFPNRGGVHSNFTWNHTHFDGCDWDAITNQKALYLLDGKHWEDQVDLENGNFDYLMGADLDMQNEETFAELLAWGKWYLDFTGVDGFRLDAVKHIHFPKLAAWLLAMRAHSKKDVFAVGEYWNQTLSALLYFLDKTAHSMCLFDVPLHYNLHRASQSNGEFDLRKLFEGTLVKERPKRAVTLVDNHDTQPGQALQSWVAGWFKLHAYALILLREEGLPCVFYGDLYGIAHSGIAPVGKKLEQLLRVRCDFAYGEQIEYFHNPDIVGFTRLGDAEHAHSGLAVVLTDREGGSLRMCMGASFIGKTLVDCLGNCQDKVVVEPDGCAYFPVSGGSVSVYVDEQAWKA